MGTHEPLVVWVWYWVCVQTHKCLHVCPDQLINFHHRYGPRSASHQKRDTRSAGFATLAQSQQWLFNWNFLAFFLEACNSVNFGQSTHQIGNPMGIDRSSCYSVISAGGGGILGDRRLSLFRASKDMFLGSGWKSFN